MLRKLYLCLTMGLMIVGTLAGINLLTTGHKKSVECENVFTSGIYPEYHRQLKAYIQQHPFYMPSRQGFLDLDVKMQQLVDFLEKPDEGFPQQHRSRHENFVKQLRQIIADREHSAASEENASTQLLDGIINWIFLNPDLYNEVEDFLSAYLSPPASNQSILDYLPLAQKNLHQKLKLSRQKQKNVQPEDHYLSGNLPLKVFEGQTKLIRIAQPLLGNSFLPTWLSAPVASPEFLAFLKQQKNHLYVNLMRRHGVEGGLSFALENLEISIPQLSVVSLDKDSDFYWQKGPQYPEFIENDQFKNQFLGKLIEPSGGYYWSSHLEMSIWEKQLQGLIGGVETKFFSGRTKLNKVERQDFIELTYLAIINALTETLQPDSLISPAVNQWTAALRS